MRRTLTLVFITFIVLMAMIPAQASWVSEMLFGRHREIVRPGIKVTIDERYPEKWGKLTDFNYRYHKDEDRIFIGTRLEIQVTIMNESMLDAKFAVCITDKKYDIGDESGDLNFDLPAPRRGIGGLKVLKTFRGKSGNVELRTGDYDPGTRNLHVICLAQGRKQKFSEQVIPLFFAPPLDEVVEILKDAPEETLKSWGLTSYPTLEEVSEPRDHEDCRFDISFADGRTMSDVKIDGKPCPGRLLGVRTPSEMIGVIKVDDVGDGVVQSSSSSKFLDGCRSSELTVEWVVKTRIYTEKVVNRPMTSVQCRNLMSFPDSDNPNSSVFGLRNAVKEMYDAGMVHLNEPYKQNMSIHYWQMYQGRVPEYTYSKSPEKEAYVPELKAKSCRVVRLASDGTPVVKIEAATITRVDTKGLWDGLAYIIGQRVRRPDRINNSTTVDVDQSQQQQQQQQQEVGINMDP